MIMDAAESTDDAVGDFSKVCSFYLKIDNATFPSTLKQNNTVIKYTKLPDFDFDSKVIWPQNSYTLPPRLRRIISVDDQLQSSRSLNTDSLARRIVSSSFNNRKIVTISEDDENDYVSRYKNDIKKSTTMTKASGTDPVRKQQRIRITPTKTTKTNKPAANVSSKETPLAPKPITTNRYKSPNVGVQNFQNNVNKKVRNAKEKEIIQRNTCSPPRKVNVNKNTNQQRNIKVVDTNNDMLHTLNSGSSTQGLKQHVGQQTKLTPVKDKIYTSKPQLASVPHNDNVMKKLQDTQLLVQPIYRQISKIDCSTEVEIKYSDAEVATNPAPFTVDGMTEMEKIFSEEVMRREPRKSSKLDTKVDVSNEFDSLEIPNVTLIKDKSDNPKEDLVNLHSQSLPNLHVPLLKFKSQTYEHVNDRKCSGKGIHSSTSYIIRKATLTYTARQDINCHSVDNNCHTDSDLQGKPLIYPMNVVSVFKKKLENKQQNNKTAVENSFKENDKSNTSLSQSVNETRSKSILIENSFANDSKKLVKPSDIISTISVNNDLLKSDYICEQFQRELNFIDSFFESLQYLENCSLSNHGLTNHKVENWVSNSGFDIKNPEYNSFFSKFDNCTDNEDTETMASKSLCLLNLLIRDEQRRAKNLLFVLKMREDALKDFTKSQILWLENKKKQDNTDISTLKKKQRGALLKLQHECGEMQRMRKALLALSEKRKVALMKTKKNIELKLKNNITVEQIALGKKKLKRIPASDRAIAPLKCFDLSSSGCDETGPRVRSDSIISVPEVTVLSKRVEKSIQTGDSILESNYIDKGTDTSTENFVAVDGGYLNILFHNFSLPQIFSSGKQYEVNEDALKNIVNSTNSNNSVDECNVVEKFIDQIKFDLDKSANSTPSTARSLVEEFDQYYKGLTEEEKSPTITMERDSNTLQNDVDRLMINDSRSIQNFDSLSTIKLTIDSSDIAANKTASSDEELLYNKSSVITVTSVIKNNKQKDTFTSESQRSQSPIASANASTDSFSVDSEKSLKLSSSSSSSAESNINSQHTSSGVPCITSAPTPVHSEAEELRRQQLAVEREIKALEQQQLLVVREIPDKPPPPYTPPNAETRANKFAHMFIVDNTIEQKIHDHINGSRIQSIDAPVVDVFVSEYCDEMLEKQNSDNGDKPWDACNLLPPKPLLDVGKLMKKVSSELKDILSGAQPTVVTGVGARRSDHIDDILFAEWRRSEPEWTTLHADEASVKNQIFESIFQKVLTDTVDEFKKVAKLQDNE